MVSYRTYQDQMNDVIGFGMSLMFMGVMFGIARSLITASLESGEQSRLFPQTRGSSVRKITLSKEECSNPRWGEIATKRYAYSLGFTDKTTGDIGWRNPGNRHQFVSFRRSTRDPRTVTVYNSKTGTLEVLSVASESPSLVPQAMIEDCEPVPTEYRYLVGWLRGSLPDYSLLTLPAVVPEAGDRKIDVVLKQLKDGVESIQQSDRFRLFLVTMSKFHEYSIGNLILIAIQKPTATRVAGFNTWRDLGRWVKKGERGISILAPVMPPRPTCARCGAKLPKSVSFCPKCGEEVEEVIGVTPTYFRVVYVFDVSQTEGKPLAEFEAPVLTGEANDELFARVTMLAKEQGLDVSFESRPEQNPEVKGQYSRKSIWVRPEESRAQQFKTLLHEVAHYYSEGVFQIPRRDAETIAESAAFAVGAHFGFDTGVRSFPYVALWAQDKKVLEQNLATIRKVTITMIEALEKMETSRQLLLPTQKKMRW